MSSLAWLIVFLTSAWIGLGLLSVALATRRRSAPRLHQAPPLTVLKPLCGADPSLESNLESFFGQSYPDFELVFGVERSDDPAREVVERLIARHPEVRARLVVHRTIEGHNPKVRNLRGMMRYAAHDLVLISDSNVRAPTDYLESMAREMGNPEVGLVTSLFTGAGGGSLGGDLERVQLSGFCAAGSALPTLVGYAAVIGKSMMFSRSELERLGGLGRVADVLAEDFVIGKMFQRANRRVAISSTIIENVIGRLEPKTFLARQLRWSMLRFRLRPVAYLLEPLTSPLATLPIAWSVMGPWSLLWATTLLLVRDAGGWAVLSGSSGIVTAVVLSPVREVAALAVWLVTPFKRHVSWRGTKLRITAGTALVAES